MTNAGAFIKDLSGITELSFPIPWGEVRKIADKALDHELSEMRKHDREKALEILETKVVESIGLVLTDRQLRKLEDFIESEY